MSQLDELIAQWATAVETAEPDLAPHLDEIEDHLRTDAEVRIAAGSDASTAFAAAVGSFGAPRRVADEYLKSARAGRRFVLRLAAAYLALVLVSTIALVVVDGFYPLDAKWVGIGWTLLVISPAAALPFVMRSFLARAGELPGGA